MNRARSNTLPNPPPSVRTINIDSHKVEANDALITGNNNMIFGNNNRIAGDYNKIYGNNNVVIGSGNSLKGEYNSARGSGNEVHDPFGKTMPPSPMNFTTPPPPQVFSPPPVDLPRKSSADNTYFQPIPPTASSRQPSFDYQSPPPASPRQPSFDYQSPPPASPRQVSYEYPSASSANYDYQSPPSANYDYQSPPSPGNYSSQGSYSPSPYSQGPVYLQAMPLSPPPTGYIIIPQSPVHYVNPFRASSPTPYANPFDAPKEKKEKDLIQDGTLVFIINECESEYVQEFCELIATKSGCQVGWHNSVGRNCIVGLGDLEKIRDTIITQLPLLNLRLKEWSWNSFGKRVCNDKEVFEKKLFKEYTREDVDCWRKKVVSASASQIKIPA